MSSSWNKSRYCTTYLYNKVNIWFTKDNKIIYIYSLDIYIWIGGGNLILSDVLIKTTYCIWLKIAYTLGYQLIDGLVI